MKKTIAVNIAGLVFNIEEKAYETLQIYLDEIKHILALDEGLDEILQDIEARIAELFHGKLSEFKQVITFADVTEVMEMMGDPSQYQLDDETGDSNEKQVDETIYLEQKRLFRDEDDGIVGGVAAGLAHYFGVDPVVVRIIFVLMLVLGGSGVLLYLILWVVIPSAKTTAQKLQMRGQPVNIDNIKEYVNTVKNEAKTGFSNASKSVHEVTKRSTTAIGKLLLVVSKVFGFLLMIGGLVSFVTILALHFGSFNFIVASEGESPVNMSTLAHLIYVKDSTTIGFWSLFFTLIIPVIMLAIVGVKLLFELKEGYKKLFVTGTVLWILAAVTLTFVGIETGMAMSSKYTYFYEVDQEEEMGHDTLYVNMQDYSFDSDFFGNTKNDFFELNADSVKIGFPMVNVRSGKGIDQLKVHVKKRSNGLTLKEAKKFAENISYAPKLIDNRLHMPSGYQFPVQDQIRGQYVSLEISLPVGKHIVFPSNLDDFPLRFEACEHFSDDYLEQASIWKATPSGMKYIGVYRGGFSQKIKD
jgi:phage shock protein PspC (stress-responsive transcriptional regulator)